MSPADFTAEYPPQPLLNTLRSFFSSREEVAAVYLFGSAAEGTSGARGDVDLGLLYRRNFRPDFEYLGRLKTDLAHEVQAEVDIVDLRAASPILRMQVLRKGRLVIQRDPKAGNNFFVNTLLEYMDLKRVRRPIELRLAQSKRDG